MHARPPLAGLVFLLAGFDGRVGRGAFWCGSILVALLLFAVGEAVSHLAPGLAQPLGAFAGGFALYPWCALAAKRAHDRGRPGLYGIVLVLGTVLPRSAAAALPAPWPEALGLVSIVFWLVALVDLGLLPAAAVAGARESATPAR